MIGKKGQVAVLSFLVAIVLFITVVQFIDPLKTSVTQARTSLGCGGGGLTTGVEMTCIFIDVYFFIFIASMFTVAGAFAINNKVRELQSGG